MIVLFAPAKTFRDIEEIKDEELIFKNKTNEIVSILSKLDYKTIIEFFNVSDDIANEVKEYYEDFYNKPTHLAFRFFYGQSFQSFDFDNLDKKHYSFLNSNVYIKMLYMELLNHLIQLENID